MDTTIVNSTHAPCPVSLRTTKASHRRRVRGEVIAFSRQTGNLVLRSGEGDDREIRRSFEVPEKAQVICAPLIGKQDARPLRISQRLDRLEPGQEVIIDYDTVDGRDRVLVICYRM